MPTSFDPAERPAAMFRLGRPVDPTFDPGEVFYSRCAAINIIAEGDEVSVATSAFRAPNTSMLRAKYAEPDHARWDSAFDAGDRAPQLHREAYVLRVPLSSLPTPEQILEETGGLGHDFRPMHVPFDDNYAHSEIHAFKGDVRIERESQFKNQLDKKAKYLFRRLLADRASVILQPGEIIPANG